MPQGRSHARSSSATASCPPTAEFIEDRDGSARITLVAVIVTLIDEEPSVHLVSTSGGSAQLPTVSYRLDDDVSLDEALRSGILRETGLGLGHLDQLTSTTVRDPDSDTTALSIGYLALANLQELAATLEHEADPRTSWRSWYAFFPWEDWRRGRPAILEASIEQHLRAWAAHETASDQPLPGLTRLERVRMAFGLDGIGWDEERVAERFDLLQQADVTLHFDNEGGDSLPAHHLRLLAVAIGRLRARIKQRPVVFELMAERFTLFELQRTVEAILGPHLHKQNFRRLVEHMGLVEPTEAIKSHTGGRPAKLFRFRQSVLIERLQPGVRVRTARN